MRFYNIPMEDGTNLPGTLNLGALADLAQTDHDLWKVYNTIYKNIQKNGDAGELDMAKILYVGYRCAVQHEGEWMQESEFLYALTDDREKIAEAFTALFGKGKSESNFQRSSEKQ